MAAPTEESTECEVEQVAAPLSEEQTPSEEQTRTILSVCKQHLDEKEFVYREEVTHDHSYIKAGVTGMNGSYDLLMDIKEERKILIIYVRSSLRFPVGRRKQLAEYLTRSNYGLVLGNFELDMNDGEVRYKCSVPASSGERGTDLAVGTVDRMMGAGE